MLFPTPFYELSEDDKNYVYDPAEDSFLLLDALEKDVKELRIMDPGIVIEVGCGSGIVSAFLKQIIQQPVFLIATDVNARALKCSKKTASLNAVDVELIHCDLLLPLQQRLQNAVDIIVFNPPYVNTDDNDDSALALSWAGGPTGRGVLNRLLPLVPELLSSYGVMYIVALKSNDIAQIFSANPKLIGSVVLERRCGCEYLYILKFRKAA